MRQVFGPRPDHLGAQEAPGAVLRIHPQRAFILQHDPAAPLVFERYFTDREFRFARLTQHPITLPQRRHLRLAERNRQRRAAQAGTHVREAAGVVASDLAMVGRFRQHRTLIVGVTGDEHVAGPALHRGDIECGYAIRAQFQAHVFDADPVDIGRAAGRLQHILKALGHFDAASVADGQRDRVAIAHRAHHLGLEAQVEFLAQRARGRMQHVRVGQVGDAAAAREQRHAHAQARQCLAQFQADHAGADHGDRRRQVGPFEHVVAGDHAFDAGQLRQRGGGRAGGDHDARRFHFGVVIDKQGVRPRKTRMAAQLVTCRDAIDAFQYKADETVALAPDPLHYGDAVDAHLARVHAKAAGGSEHVRRLAGGDQQFAGHAADPGTGGAIRAAFDQDDTRAVRVRGAVGGQAGGAGANDGHIDLQLFHGAFLRIVDGMTIRSFVFRCRAGRLPATT